MSVQEQIAKLESLLGRIKKNAELPRPAGVAQASPAPAAREELPPMSGSPPTARVEAHVVPMARRTPEHGTPAQAAPRAELEELDMMDSEIVELEGAGAPPMIDADELELVPVPADEPVPESAPRAAQALADEADLEPPVKTPPPESGRQYVAPAPAVSFKGDEAEEADLAGGSDVDGLLDLSGGPISKAPPGQPTMEQLGETVELEGADAPPAELELQGAEEHDEIAADELEVSLPRGGFHGGYDQALAPPSEAARDLARMREADPTSIPAPSSLAEPASAPVTRAAETRAAPVAPAPTIVERPALEAAHVAEVLAAKPVALPSTFLELLDTSLGL